MSLDFFQDMDNYEERKVANTDIGDITVDTARVSDGRQSYETALAHPEYNEGKWIIVEAYDTKKEARAGPQRWVKNVKADQLPDPIQDCCNAGIMELATAVGVDSSFPRVRP